MKEKKKISVWYILLLVIILIIGVIIGYLLNNNESEDQELPDGTNMALLTPTVSYTRSNKSSSVPKNTVVEFVGTFKYSGTKIYYYTWQVISGTKVVGTTSCKKIDYTDTSNAKITITDKNQYGRWTIYSDSSCTKKVKSYRTAKYSVETNSSSSTSKTFTATFNANGASSIGATTLSCTTIKRTCTVKAPSITRNGYNSVGWSKRKNASFALYQENDLIVLYSNTTFYAITTKVTSNNSTSNSTVKMVKYSDSLDSGMSGTLSSVTYPIGSTVSYKSSNSKVIRIEKGSNGVYTFYTILPGTATITATSSTGATDSVTYTVNNISEQSASEYLVDGISSTTSYDGYNIYVEKGCSNIISRKYINDIKAIPINQTYPKAVYILTNDSLLNRYPTLTNTWGLTSGKANGLYVSIVCDQYRETVVAHEFGHVLDYYYSFITGKATLSNNADMITLYKTYNVNTALSDNQYAYDDVYEFFATSYSYYYMKHYAPNKWSTRDFNSNKYPSDLESVTGNLIKTAINEI